MLGDLIKTLRTSRGRTQASVSRYLKELPSNYSAFEKGRRSLSPEKLDALFALLVEPYSLRWYSLYSVAGIMPPMMRTVEAEELKVMGDELVRYRYSHNRHTYVTKVAKAALL